ncbi:hypothetical protein FACS1894162_8930 [Bacteroidia bacterium]|nr:hypothetical protein FACS1894162_8930 [Bacteroidia bacterium]
MESKKKRDMEGFKKEKTAENQLFDVFIKDFFCELENKQKSVLFERKLNKEAVFVNQLTQSVGHSLSDRRLCFSIITIQR